VGREGSMGTVTFCSRTTRLAGLDLSLGGGTKDYKAVLLMLLLQLLGAGMGLSSRPGGVWA
jgi:hypothetical protein